MWNHQDVLDRLALFVDRGVPVSGPITEFLAAGRTLYIEPGSPWENGYVESFNGKLRDQCRDLDTLWEAKVLAERWHRGPETASR